MLNSVDFSGRPFHFIGIGGIGMSALAYILTQRRLPVSGSDLRLSHITQRLQDAGAHIFWQQDAENLRFFQEMQGDRPGADNTLLPQVVCSTAITDNNSEYRAAKQLGCSILHRSDLLAALMQQYSSVAVAGTHGKTTTSSMVSYVLLQAGLDPTVVIGGEVAAWQGNARLGQSDWLVAEADESDGTLSKLRPAVGVITNIELDHTDHYRNLEDVIATFRQFAEQSETVIASADCPTIQAKLSPDITYSLQPDRDADYWADEIAYQAAGTNARIWERDRLLGYLQLPVLGCHNLSNALAAIAVGRHLGLSFDTLAQGLSSFEGARRRFELRGYHHGIQFIDDYAHHPSEIRATLAAANLRRHHNGAGLKRIVAVFQPHRYSRTVTFMDDFSEAFQEADTVIVTDIYSAGETNQHNVSGQDLAAAIGRRHGQVHYCPTLDDVQAMLSEHLQPGDMALFLGAGNLNRIIPDVMAPFVETEARAVQRA